MIAQQYKEMLGGKSVIRQLSEFATERGKEIGYENVFDYSLGNPSVPAPKEFTESLIKLLQNENPMNLHGYSQSLGIPSVREAVAESLNRRFGMTYKKEHIFMTSAAAGAIAAPMLFASVIPKSIIFPTGNHCNIRFYESKKSFS